MDPLKKTAVGLLLALLISCSGVTLPPIVIPTPPPDATCPERCPEKQACLDPKKGCQSIMVPEPECLPLVPWCHEMTPPASCSSASQPCKHNPTSDPAHCELAAPCVPVPTSCASLTCPEPGDDPRKTQCQDTPNGPFCVMPNQPPPPLPPPPSAGLIPDEELTATEIPVDKEWDETWAATNTAIDAWRGKHPEAWRGDGACLVSVAGIDAAFAGIAGELGAVGIVAGQSIDSGGQRSDCLWVNKSGTNLYAEAHLFDYGRACVATGRNAIKRIYSRKGSSTVPVPPPPTSPPVGSCPAEPCPAKVWTEETLPDGWGRDQIGKARWEWSCHESGRMWEDCTPIMVRSWDYCNSIGMGFMADGSKRAACPVRPDGHPEREAVERWLLGGAPVPDGPGCDPEGRPAFAVPRLGHCRLCSVDMSVCSGVF